MDPIVLAAGTAIVGAIATSGYQQVREAVAGLWRRIRQGPKADEVAAELDQLREQILLARRNSDMATEKALEGAWQVKLQQLLRVDAALATELESVLERVLIPALTPSEQDRVAKVIMTGSSHDFSTFTQVGIQNIQNRP